MPSFKSLLGGNIRVTGQAIVDAKLLAAAPRILAQNRVMVEAMLHEIKPIVGGATPIGPGHFGYHGRDTLKIKITSAEVATSGKLLAAVQLYWREFGTRSRFRGPSRLANLRASTRIMTGRSGTGGEKAYMTAHKAAGLVKRFITFYYNGMANWWRA